MRIMETNKQNEGNVKHEATTIFNLIILDESGSMSGVRNATISGCNEVLNVARQSQKEHEGVQRQLVSVYAFQGGANRPSRYIFKNVKVSDCRDINHHDYEPWGSTPLYDAVGSTLSELRAIAQTHENATGIITIITDGYENSSTHYTLEKVTKIISAFKEQGWQVNFIGANIDVEKVAAELHIDSAMAFSQDEEGTKAMFSQMAYCSNALYDFEAQECGLSKEERIKNRKSRRTNFFK